MSLPLFGVWPPQGTARLIGACAVNSDGTLGGSSRYPDGSAVFTSAQVSPGVYTVTLTKPAKVPVFSLTAYQTASRVPTVAGATINSVTVHTFDATGAPADSSFTLVYEEL